jgi:hypothetical protein
MSVWSNVSEINCRLYKISVCRHNKNVGDKNFRLIIYREPVSQTFSLIPPSSSPPVSKYQNKSSSFHVSLRSIFNVCIISLSFQNKSNKYSYIFGEVALKSQRKPLSKRVRKIFEFYCGCEIEDRDGVLASKITAAHVQGLWQVGYYLPKYQWLWLFWWFSVGLETAPRYAIFTWSRSLFPADFPSLK